ncbi:hypothetical protein FRAHR75_630008 [Frankia sp. Hr75.2]|nr:hypothetical protein FRAHR75_630008 [Frankia sp. Hr75.2]
MAVWEAGLEELFGRVADCFRSDQPRAQARAYVAGLLSRTERKNGWTLAEFTREAGPQKMQRLLNEYAWDAHAMRDVVQSYVVENLTEPDGVLVVDETGFVKKGTSSAGVQRQYSGTAGRIENCQIGVFAAYVSGKGRAFVDRELYLPTSWTDDRARCKAAGVPARVGFATKPLLALDKCQGFPKRHQAVSGYWHTPTTLAAYLRVRSYLVSARDHGLRAIDAIRLALAGRPWLPVLRAASPTPALTA